MLIQIIKEPLCLVESLVFDDKMLYNKAILLQKYECLKKVFQDNVHINR